MALMLLLPRRPELVYILLPDYYIASTLSYGCNVCSYNTYSLVSMVVLNVCILAFFQNSVLFCELVVVGDLAIALCVK